VIIECPNCHAKYKYDEQRFERKPVKKIKCARCATIFEIFNPAFAERIEAKAAGERTYSRREQPAPPREETAERQPFSPGTGKAPPGEPQLPRGKRISLAIIDGPDAGSVFRMEKPRVTIGRTGADLTLNDTEASRLHAAVEARDTAVFLFDLGSTNGTLVNGQKVNGSIELLDKAEFQVGATTLMLIVTEDA
jgi:predicted Zn finger-like uncharacterized protein